jgi:hypothetical protein
LYENHRRARRNKGSNQSGGDEKLVSRHNIRLRSPAKKCLGTQVQAFTRLQDGSAKVTITESALMIEKVSSPPEDVLGIINGVVVP